MSILELNTAHVLRVGIGARSSLFLLLLPFRDLFLGAFGPLELFLLRLLLFFLFSLRWLGFGLLRHRCQHFLGGLVSSLGMPSAF